MPLSTKSDYIYIIVDKELKEKFKKMARIEQKSVSALGKELIKGYIDSFTLENLINKDEDDPRDYWG